MKQKLTITIADVQMNIVTEESPEAVENLRSIVDRRIREIYLQSGNRCPKTEAALLCALDYCAERAKMQEEVSRLEEELKIIDIEAEREKNSKLASELEAVRGQLAATEEAKNSANSDVSIANEQLRILTQKTVETEALVEALKNKLSEVETELLAKNVEIERLSAELQNAGAEKAECVETMEEEVLAEQDAAEPVEEVAEEAAEAVAVEATEEATEEVAEEVTEEKAEQTEAEASEPKPPVTELADSTVADLGIEMKPLRTRVDENQLTIDLAPAEETPSEEKAESSLNIEKEKQKAQKRVRSMFDLITFDNV
jgi:chromosome segregation ATPase